jgi:hypothetical protein
VLDDGVFHPVGIGGAGAAVRFEIIDADFAGGNLGAADDEPMAVAGEGEISGVGRSECEEEEPQDLKETSVFHGTHAVRKLARFARLKEITSGAT